MIRSPLVIGTILAVFHVLPALADTQQIGAFQSWGAYVSRNPKTPNAVPDACYISSKPIHNVSKSHAGVFAEVTHRPAEHHLGVIDILENHALKTGAPATLMIGKVTFTLFSNGAATFAKDDDDAKIVAAMRAASATKNATMTFVGLEKNGGGIKETFSLVGMEQAYQTIGKACHVSSKPAKKT